MTIRETAISLGIRLGRVREYIERLRLPNRAIVEHVNRVTLSGGDSQWRVAVEVGDDESVWRMAS